MERPESSCHPTDSAAPTAASSAGADREACTLSVSGVVQGVGFRPFVARLAARLGLTGWVLNDSAGVRIHVEGARDDIERFVERIVAEPPPAADIRTVTARRDVALEGHPAFVIRPSPQTGTRSVPVGADLPACDDCLRELRDPYDRRCGYPYINCTNCGPRYTVVLGLPYDRPNTTMRAWPMCEACRREYDDPADRRYHAQPIACGACGPHLALEFGERVVRGDADVVAQAAALLRDGAIVAVKGLGGYHLACDARNERAVGALRERKFRKDKPFAMMVRDVAEARALAVCGDEDVALLAAAGRPIVLIPARDAYAEVAPNQSRVGIMLPYAPLHALLFDAGAPPALVMTSGNRSNEPIAFDDADARARLGEIADAILSGERPIARRADDSVAAAGPLGVVLLRRSRGYAPGVVATLPAGPPILALGADLKNTVTVVVDGQAIASPHIGDLDHLESFAAFTEAVGDLLAIYALTPRDMRIVHDLHPRYRSTGFAAELGGEAMAVQHHHAHIASVLAEHALPDEPVLGLALDGTGYGTDGTIWGCELLTGSLRTGFTRVGHLVPYVLPGGDAAARYPALCALGALGALDLADLTAPPFGFARDTLLARQLLAKRIHAHVTTSAGRLFDAVAALCGFTARVTFEGQAAMWLEYQAERGNSPRAYPTNVGGGLLDVRALLAAVVADRRAGVAVPEIARAFHLGFAHGLVTAARVAAPECGPRTIVLSGGVWQNGLLLDAVSRMLSTAGYRILTNRAVPVNDGGISLGQAALAAYGTATSTAG